MASIKKVQRPSDFIALTKIVPFPFGPDMGMHKLASPDVLLISMLPEANRPSSIRTMNIKGMNGILLEIGIYFLKCPISIAPYT